MRGPSIPISLLVGVLLVLIGASTVGARNTKYMFLIEEAMNTPAAKEKLGNTVTFYFGNQPHPRVVKHLGEYVTNRKTNAFNKSDEDACEWVFLSAMLALRDRAVREGGNAVINIKSYYRKKEVISDTEYECHAGAILAGVALKGVVVELVE